MLLLRHVSRVSIEVGASSISDKNWRHFRQVRSTMSATPTTANELATTDNGSAML
jgi:hypothetical protein